MSIKPDKNSATSRVEKAIKADVPKIYFNGFAIVPGTSDFAISLELNGQPAALLNCSYTISKSLAETIGTSISSLETLTGNEIMTNSDIVTAIEKQADEKKSEIKNI